MQQEVVTHRRARVGSYLGGALIALVTVVLVFEAARVRFDFEKLAHPGAGLFASSLEDLKWKVERLRAELLRRPTVVRQDFSDTTLVDTCRDELTELTSNEALARQARIVPTIRDGEPIGLKLYAMRPESLFATLGLQNGDTLRSVNGVDLTSPETALEAYGRARAASSLDLRLERRGSPRRLVILLHERCAEEG